MSAERKHVTLEELTQHQRDKIAELRARLKPHLEDYPSMDTDFQYLRWLIGWDYDIDVIVPKFIWSVNTLKALKCNALPLPDNFSPQELNAWGRTQSSAVEYYPGGVAGEDRFGNVITMQAIARIHPQSLIKAGRVSDFYRLSIIEGEAACQLVRRNEAKYGRKLGIAIVTDLDGFSTDLLYMPTLKIYRNLLTILQNIFPDMGATLYVINSPAMMQALYALIEPVLAKQTRQKVRFLGSDWKQKLADDLGIENIYKHWGGTKEHEKSVGDLRMGGKVPEHHLFKESNYKEFIVDDSQLKKENVSAGKRKTVPVRVSKPGQKIRWFFKCSSGDIDFAVVDQSTSLEIWPKFRITTEVVPEFGEVEVTKPGDYQLVFENLHGTFWSKDIKYSVKVLD